MTKISVTVDGHSFEIGLDFSAYEAREFSATVDGTPVRICLSDDRLPFEETQLIIVNDRPHEISFDTALRWIKTCRGAYPVEIHDLGAKVSRPVSGDGRVKAPIPGLITRVLVNMGDRVEVDQPLLVLEAMKMENEIRAPRAGVISALPVEAGQSVSRGDVLVEVEAQPTH